MSDTPEYVFVEHKTAKLEWADTPDWASGYDLVGARQYANYVDVIERWNSGRSNPFALNNKEREDLLGRSFLGDFDTTVVKNRARVEVLRELHRFGFDYAWHYHSDHPLVATARELVGIYFEYLPFDFHEHKFHAHPTVGFELSSKRLPFQTAAYPQVQLFRLKFKWATKTIQVYFQKDYQTGKHSIAVEMYGEDTRDIDIDEAPKRFKKIIEAAYAKVEALPEDKWPEWKTFNATNDYQMFHETYPELEKINKSKSYKEKIKLNISCIDKITEKKKKKDLDS